jgi:hypothetical protein
VGVLSPSTILCCRGFVIDLLGPFLSAFAFCFLRYIAFTSTVFQPSTSSRAVVGALGRGVSWVSGPAGEGVGSIEVGAIVSWHGGYLIMRASSVSWVAEVAWHQCIRLYSSQASHGHCVVGCLFAGIIGLLSWPLAHHFLLPGGSWTASRTS